jgi:RsiW-degrading membrane proteinase PrsW (M82 family)
MEQQRHILERKLSALKLIWKMIIVVGLIITLTIGTLYPGSTAAWIVIMFLWGGFIGLISYVFHKINSVRLHLQRISPPPEPIQIVYPSPPPAYFADPVYPQDYQAKV